MKESTTEKLSALREVVAELRTEGRPPVNWQGGDQAEEGGPITFRFVVNTDAQNKALQVLIDHGLVFYDALNSTEMYELYESLNPDDIPLWINAIDIRKVLVRIYRLDYFYGGVDWSPMFASGKGLALFERWLEFEERWASTNLTIAEAEDVGEKFHFLFNEYLSEVTRHNPDVFSRRYMDNEQAEVATLYSPPHGRLLVATTDDWPQGFLTMKHLSDDTVQITYLFTTHRMRGLGLAKLLLNTAVDTARRDGYKKIFLEYMPHLGESQSIFQRFGFTHFNPADSHSHQDLIPMEMVLRA